MVVEKVGKVTESADHSRKSAVKGRRHRTLSERELCMFSGGGERKRLGQRQDYYFVLLCVILNAGTNISLGLLTPWPKSTRKAAGRRGNWTKNDDS